MAMLILRKTISSRVADGLRARILAGEYPADFQLRQEHIATEFGVSRIPVREALHQLHSEGFVRLISHKGAVVSSISLPEILELFELRARIETWLLELAIPRMTTEHLKAARQRARQHEEQAKKAKYLYSLNWDFHASLYEPSGRRSTIDMIARIHQKLERYTLMMVSLTETRDRSDEEHWELIRLCDLKDVRGASDLLEAHIVTGGRYLVDRLKELGTPA